MRFVPRFVAEAEIPALFRRADVIALPYRDAEHSGVVYTALAFGKPMVLSSVGGFPELAAEHGAARIVAPEDPAALAAALDELVADPAARAELAAAARRAAEGPFSWDAVAARTLALYRELAPDRDDLDRAGSGLLGLGGADRLHAPRLSAGAVAARAGCGRAREPRRSTAALPSVSLIVAAHDEEDVIAAKVADALALDYPRELLEVIVASDGSSDATVERAREAGADHVLDLPRGGKVGAQNAAVEAARGEVLAFSDANCLWEAGALRALVAPPRGPGRRLRLRPGPLHRPRGRQPRGRLLALRDGGPPPRVRLGGVTAGNGGDLRGPARRLHRAAALGQPRPLLPLRAAPSAGCARSTSRRRSGRGEDGPHPGRRSCAASGG